MNKYIRPEIDDLRTLNYRRVTGWGRWCTGYRWSRLWSLLSASVRWRCTCSFASPACLRIVCGAILARKVAGHLVVKKHCQVSLYPSLHLFMPRKLNTLLLLVSDLSTLFLNEIFCFLYCGTQKPFFCHFGYIQHQVHVGLLQLYPTSWPCHHCRHVETLPDISCCS